MTCALRLNDVAEAPSDSEKAKEALERIAKMSRLNAVRVRAFLG